MTIKVVAIDGTNCGTVEPIDLIYFKGNKPNNVEVSPAPATERIADLSTDLLVKGAITFDPNTSTVTFLRKALVWIRIHAGMSTHTPGLALTGDTGIVTYKNGAISKPTHRAPINGDTQQILWNRTALVEVAAGDTYQPRVSIPNNVGLWHVDFQIIELPLQTLKSFV